MRLKLTESVCSLLFFINNSFSTYIGHMLCLINEWYGSYNHGSILRFYHINLPNFYFCPNIEPRFFFMNYMDSACVTKILQEEI